MNISYIYGVTRVQAAKSSTTITSFAASNVSSLLKGQRTRLAPALAQQANPISLNPIKPSVSQLLVNPQS
jgi:hypothetical protein